LWHVERWLKIMEYCILVSTFAFYSLHTFTTNKCNNKILTMSVDVLKLSDWIIRDLVFSSRLVSVKMNLDSEKIANPRINRLLLNPKGIFVMLGDRVIPTIFVRFYFLVKITRGKSVLILLVIRAFTFCFCYQTACYSRYNKFSAADAPSAGPVA